MNIQDIITKVKDLLHHTAPEAKAILYGSQARGDANKDSDIDILVLLPDTYEGKKFVKTHGSISDQIYMLSLELGVDISPLILLHKVFFARKTLFTLNVINEGIEL